MCGLAGFIRTATDAAPFTGEERYKIFTSMTTDFSDVFETLGEDVDSRGGDGCGLTLVADYTWDGHSKVSHDTPRVNTFKKVSRFTGWTNLANYSVGQEINNSYCGILHTRKGSSGGNSLDTTHPIKGKNIILSHNGTLSNWRTHFKDNPTSDTQGIVSMIESEGAKHTFETLEGPMTVMWLDPKAGHFHVHRSADRPLSYVDVLGYRLFASESWMLYKALDVNGISVDGLEIVEFPSNTHHVYSALTGKLLETHTYKPAERTKNAYSCGVSYNTQYDRDYKYPSYRPTPKKPTTTSPELLIKDKEKYCNVVRGGWVVGRPYATVETNASTNISKLMMMADSTLTFNSNITPLSTDIWVFAFPTDLAKRICNNPHITLAVKCTSTSKVPTAKHPKYDTALIGTINQCIPVIDWDYDMTEEEARDALDTVIELCKHSTRYGDDRLLKLGDTALSLTGIYEYIKSGLEFMADTDETNRFNSMYSKFDYGVQGFEPVEREQYSAFYKESP